ncbi:BREX-1 system adenine-specific DNA-methyltransferase PglX, partial [Methylicorpusculum sp.]|uniref:BREX-1 system adenine-specific DNA-methyltransferase PglX n=1 Tax=Methylicorpusculum sp. TaxID=2713644 RepID=UPI002AB893BA
AHAKTFGSLIQIPSDLNAQLSAMDAGLQLAIQSGDLIAQEAALNLLPLVRQAQILGMQFNAVVANPPYMGFKYYTPKLKDFIYDHYSSGKHDLFSAFIIRMNNMLKNGGMLSIMTPFTWMFLPSFEALRAELLDDSIFTSIVKPEYHAFFESAYVPVCAFSIIHLSNQKYRSWYINLDDFYGAELQPIKLREAIQNKNLYWIRQFTNTQVSKVPGKIFALNLSEEALKAFSVFEPISNYASPKQGLKTGNNDKFLRYWFEVNLDDIEFHATSADEFEWSVNKKWCPIQKGGVRRRWFGNHDFVINWKNNGEELKCYVDKFGRQKSRPQGLDFAFRKGATWTTLTVADFSMRLSPEGFLSESAGSVCYPKHEDNGNYLLAFFCSSVMIYFMRAIAPTLSYSEGNVSKVPLAIGNKNKVNDIAEKAINLAKYDWDSSESSWDFKSVDWVSNSVTQHTEAPDIGLREKATNPTDASSNLEQCFKQWQTQNSAAIAQMQRLEEENNRLFIDAYGLQDELSPEVPVSQITLTRADREKDCQRLISYAIGCMMGRYSLDEPGLIYAHAGNVGFDPNRYNTFPTDADGIVPITDALWFEDDAPNRIREFLLAIWGAETLDENLTWLAESLGQKPNETPEETIRRYLAGSFFKDHLQTYKKRPIYWLFSSGKQGAFQALVYLHRYHEGTLARMRAEYVVPLTGKIQSRIEMLEKDADAADSNASRNKLNKDIEKLKKKHVELLAYDEKLRHYADLRIQLDLDDGVKVNYGKFSDLLAEVKAVTGGTSDD